MSGPPGLNRQGTITAVQGREQEIGGGCACVLLPAAIAAVVIASEYDSETSPCEGATYTIDLVLFLNIVGYAQIAYSALHICISCCSFSCSEENKQALLRLIRAPDCCLFCFYLAMAGIGLYMYENQMGEECKEEAIAIMILAWSIIQYAIIGLIIFCVICVFCCMGAVFGAAAANANVMEDSEQEALAMNN